MATNPAMSISSARRVSSIAGLGEEALRIDAEALQALPEHLPALAEGRGGDPLQQVGIAGERVPARGTSCTTDETTFGAGVKARGATSKRMRASVRHPASTPSRP